MMKRYAGLAAVFLAVGATDACAQSLKDKQHFSEHEQYLAKELAFANEKCGTSMTAKFDWLTPPTPEQRSTHSAYGYCQATLDGMPRVGESSQAGKDAVKQNIKSVTCGFGPQRSIALKDGAVDYKVNFNSSNDIDYVFEYLQNNL
jgi:hypothetical protein